MKALLNRILDREQVASILDTLLANRPVKILRVIARTGKHASSVPWVHYSNELTGEEARVGERRKSQSRLRSLCYIYFF